METKGMAISKQRHLVRAGFVGAFISAVTFSLVLSGCTTLFGTGPTAKVEVAPGLRITDLSTNERLHIDTLENGKLAFYVKNGWSHALKVEKDTRTSYVLMEPRWDPKALLNLLSPAGVGFIVDQISSSSYKYDEEYVIGPLRNGVADSVQPLIEDSLRARAGPVQLKSGLDGRHNFVVAAWLSTGAEGPTTQATIFPPWNGYGFGLQVVPWAMLTYERGSMGYIITGDLYDTDGRWQMYGVQIREPVFGLFTSLRYGMMDVSGYSYADTTLPRPTYSSELTFYSISLGFSGQWGRIEYRHRRNTSWTETPFVKDLSGSYNGIHFTLQILL